MNQYKKQRQKMVSSQLESRGIRDERVLNAMAKIPRHLFVDEWLRDRAYSDKPLPIGDRQTISQPYIVALMTEALELRGHEKVLEIGTGSGYQATVLAELADRVCSIERIASIASRARTLIESLDYFNVLIWVGDGTYGWREEAPFDAIIVTAGAPDVPNAYKEQLAVGGRLVIPVGDRHSQMLLKYTRLSEDIDDMKEEDLGGCRFVDLIGNHGWKK
ncbi:MAG: protein-L-isoaspartate(D-aspartate) O-methyltransferase [Deltaproteobacteria bacterium]|nr:protein-L-isoaspartate(D-aspartate) O-methyltransferase [Deltaproteobacteria bacterium]